MIDELFAMSPAQVALANLVVCVASFLQASAGIGYAMIAVPLLLLIDLGYAPGPSLFAMLFLSLTMMLAGRADIDRQGLASLLPGLCLGTVAGALLLGALSPVWFGLVFGVVVLAALAISLFVAAPPRSRASYGAGGFAAGLMGTISGIHGPPLAVLYQRADPARARATIALIFVIASVLSLVSLNLEGLFGRAQMTMGLSLLPGLALGYLLALRSRAHISDALARALMLTVAGVSAIVLIGKSIF